MPSRRLRRAPGLWLLTLAAAVALGLVLANRGGGSRPPAPLPPLTVAGWRGLVGSPRPQVALGQRVIVVLSAKSVAERVAAVGGRASDVDERRWTVSAFAAQQQLISKLGTRGVRVDPEFRFVRVLNGFSAAVDPQGIAVLERMPGVAAVYPVRAAYPAAVSDGAWQAWSPPASSAGGFDGRGVTIALLDTGVDRGHPFLRGRVLAGVDVAGTSADASAHADPRDATDVERHGTEMAGILVGKGGPAGLRGIAPGATVLPIRVAGWQRDATGADAVFARSDQVLAGLERAVDPNQDGDAHDAVRVALVPLSEPFGAFADSPLARAVAGALELDTLVVAPAGNDGPAGATFGSVAGPGGAPAALTVGAADLRPRTESVRVVVRTGLDVRYAGDAPLAAAAAPYGSLDLPLAAAGGAGGLGGFFDRHGFSLVAGRAALVPSGGDPAGAVAHAVDAGARAVVLYGSRVPAGALGLDARVSVPVVALPSGLASQVLATLRRGGAAAISVGAPRLERSRTSGRVATFSSRGLAFDGRVKPELVAPGVGVATSEPGRTDGGAASYGTVNGSSAAAAAVAGDAALLLQARPSLDAATLRGILVGSAHPLAGAAATAQGAGLADAGAAAATEVAAVPATLPFGRATKAGWRAHRVLLVRNLSSRALTLFVSPGTGPHEPVRVTARSRLELAPGETAKLVLTAAVLQLPAGGGARLGTIVLTPLGGRPIHVPWSLALGPGAPRLVTGVRLSSTSFAPSDARPVVLGFEAGRLGPGDTLEPVARLDVELWTGDGRHVVGTLATLRDLLPGRYAFGLTGRGPGGGVLGKGGWLLRLVATATSGGRRTVETVRFTIR